MRFESRILNTYRPDSSSTPAIIIKVVSKIETDSLKLEEETVLKMILFGYFGKEEPIIQIVQNCQNHLDCFFLTKGRRFTPSVVETFLRVKNGLILDTMEKVCLQLPITYNSKDAVRYLEDISSNLDTSIDSTIIQSQTQQQQ